ncbi:alpha/beta hydrolase family protein [Sphingomonas sp. GB1N7]|uniref:alpha/beta hydrolase family protein n=1 Tax=Parasphingomonas caseinilytica TaxID=3096158 RepID=UPI002FC6A3D5
MIAIALLAAAATSCSPAGDWDGSLTVPAGIQLPLVLHLKDMGSTIDSPDQNARGISIDVTANRNSLLVVIPSTKAQFAGTVSTDCSTLTGPFRQSGMEMKASFKRRPAGAAAPAISRPQTPQPPFPYDTSDVSIIDGAVTLAGTLTMPKGKGPFPAVVMIAGSGPQNRDETVDGHRIFLVIADRLTRQGVAVLRYDKRGVGKSSGSYANATQRDFATDATAALQWLRQQPSIDAASVGLLGHSEGAEIAPTVAGADRHVAFTVLLSAPAETGIETIASQAKAIALANGVPAATATVNDALERRLLAAVAAAPDSIAAEQAATDILTKAGMPTDRAAAQAKGLASPWYRAFLNDDPLPALQKLTVPTLVIAGSKDLQVLPDRNLPLIRRALAGNKNAKIVELPGLNHLLQPATTGSPSEYGKITTSVAPEALNLMTDWIRSIVK